MNFESFPKEEKAAETSESFEEIENELDSQEEKLNQEVSQKEYGPLSKLARKLAFTGVMMLPAFAVGCGAVEKPERPAAVKTADKGGFTDDAHENAERRLKIKRDEIKHMHENSRIIKEGKYGK